VTLAAPSPECLRCALLGHDDDKTVELIFESTYPIPGGLSFTYRFKRLEDESYWFVTGRQVGKWNQLRDAPETVTVRPAA
jgi:hypothetical protein